MYLSTVFYRKKDLYTISDIYMYLSTVFYRKKDLYTISDIEIFIFYLNLMTLGDVPALF